LWGGRGRSWESPNTDERTYTVILFIFKYFVFFPLHDKDFAEVHDAKPGCLETQFKNLEIMACYVSETLRQSDIAPIQ
jgi:hypothetical protein